MMGYDLLCIHPDPNKVTRQIRIQVKSRYPTDCYWDFPVKARAQKMRQRTFQALPRIGSAVIHRSVW
jgi:hypothetical protein